MEPIADLITGVRLRLAELQDEVIDIIYNRVEPDATLYGGTAIWRCYGGNRFSEDIDIYLSNRGLNKFHVSSVKPTIPPPFSLFSHEYLAIQMT